MGKLKLTNYYNNQKMKLSSFALASIATVESAQVKTLLNRPEEDKKVPHRHPLQRLWRLYQFTEEIIQTHFYDTNMRPRKLDNLRNRIGKWMYLAPRQSFLRNTKKCGFYNDQLTHGGPSGGEENQAGGISNEQTLLNNNLANQDVIPASLELTNPRPNRRRRDAEDEFADAERYDRDDPCVGLKQIMNGWRNWGKRYISSCGGQRKEQHHLKRVDRIHEI